jgi:tetratricopeptide (TPR) repeat protein
MRSAYAEMYLKTLCPDLSFPSISTPNVAPPATLDVPAAVTQQAVEAAPQQVGKDRDRGGLSARELHYRTAALAKNNQEFAIAEREFQAAIAAAPDDVVILQELADVQLRLKHYDASMNTLERAIGIGFPDAESLSAAQDLLVQANFARLKGDRVAPMTERFGVQASSPSHVGDAVPTYVDANVPSNKDVVRRAISALGGTSAVSVRLSGSVAMATQLVIALRSAGIVVVPQASVVIRFTSDFAAAGHNKHRQASATVSKDGAPVFRYELPAEDYHVGDNPAEAFANVLLSIFKAKHQ